MKVLIAHPHRLTAEGLACLLSKSEDIEIGGQFRSGAELIEASGRFGPDVIITTATLSDTDGPEFIRKLKASCGGAAILIVSSSGATGDFVWALDAGAAGYFGPDCDSRQFIDSVYKLNRGEVVVCGVDRRSFAGPAATNENDGRTNAAIYSLTPREREVLTLLSRGLSNREIAQELYVSEHTVRTHVQNLRSKLKVRSKFEAAVLAMQANGAASNAEWLRL